MRIIFIGSLNIFCYNFAKYFVQTKGYSVSIISRYHQNFINKDFGFVEDIFYLESNRLIPKAIAIRNYIKAKNPNIVHSFFMARDAISPLLLRNRKYKYVCSIFGSDIYHGLNKRIDYLIKRYIINNSDIVTFNSFSMKEYIKQRFRGIHNNNIFPLIWGTNFKLFNEIRVNEIEDLKKELTISSQKVILHYRRIGRVYNTDIIFKAIPFVLKKTNDVVFVFLLGNNSVSDIQNEIDALTASNAINNVRFVEKYVDHQELSNYLNMSDIVLNIPSTDMIAQSLLETMCTRAVPIISNLPAYRHFMVNKENAVFLDNISIDNLTDSIIDTLTNYDSIALKIVENNNKIVRDKFDFITQTEELIALYNLSSKKNKNEVEARIN